ncbi:hypothetical protein C475_05410 [Halosimplex carlsbadense 2-9-1]|uniref:Uncharacterized protein n=1 Tax=Halosimplex carlsbadense 2-9-1 TaxID=797114 RepID=M0D0K1_9EURY|nr:hypothetical protein [Halosimplex carlsbadense]ELZ28217.1 hypothetical protein C475_05410 [Halosimplex carlsbadense 2-9-1]
MDVWPEGETRSGPGRVGDLTDRLGGHQSEREQDRAGRGERRVALQRPGPDGTEFVVRFPLATDGAEATASAGENRKLAL